MRILFIEVVHQKTLYVQLANECKNFGCEMVVLTFSEKRKEYFDQNNCPCIDISSYKHNQYFDAKSANELINDMESKFCDYDLDQAIRKDRFLWWRKGYGSKYIKKNLKAFEKIIDNIKPDIVIGETATAFEYTLSFFCEHIGIPYRQILTCPTESPSVAIYDYSLSFDKLVKYRDGNGLKESKPSGLNYYQQLAKLQEQNKNRLTGRSLVDYIRDFNYTYAFNDYRTHLSYKLRFPVVKIYSALYWIIEKYFAVELGNDDKERYLFALHVQPESTPDYVSINYSDQFKLIDKIIKDLPDASYLYIKEHPTIISLRNPIRLLKILREKNVKLLRRDFQTKKNLRQFNIVFSICGTVLLEANRCGVPAICFSNCFYGTLTNVVDCRKFKSVKQAIDALEGSVAHLENKNLVWNDDFTHPGFYQDVGIVPEVLNKENIQNIICMINKYIRAYYSRVA